MVKLKKVLSGSELEFALLLRTPMALFRQALMKIINQKTLAKPLVHNMDGSEIDQDIVELLSLGGNFILTPNDRSGPNVNGAIDGLSRRLILRDYFGSESNLPPLFPTGNRDWTPLTPFAMITKSLLNPEHLTGDIQVQNDRFS